MKTLLMYMPVVHAGYLALICKLEPDMILIVSDEIADKYDKRRKDIRALRSAEIVRILRTLFPGQRVIINEFQGSNLPQEGGIHMPVEDISENLLEDYMGNRKVIWESVFLRYDSKKSMAPEEVVPDRTVSRSDPFIAEMVSMLSEEAQKSPDIWRQVAAGVRKDGKVLSLCHNVHVPSDVVTYALGDPRSNAQKGIATNVSKAAHAEPVACFLAGVEGCRDADLFVSTFPCPQCANFISFTGIKSLYFVEGYAMVNGIEDLRNADIEIVRVVD